MHKLPARFRTPFVLLFDLLSVIAAWVGSYLLRFNLEFERVWQQSGDGILWALFPLLLVQLGACHYAQLYRGMWRFASIPDMRRVLKAVAISALTLCLVAYFSYPKWLIPRSVVVLYPVLLFLFMAGGRLLWRMVREQQLLPATANLGTPVVIVGAGSAGMMLIRELQRTTSWRAVAFVDDDPHKRGLELHGCRVEGSVEELPQVLARHQTKHVILAMPSAESEVLQRATQMATKAGAHVFTVPGLAELMSGRVAINVMRPVKIEDLLGRETVEIDAQHVQNMLSDKRLLVTGAGGSIGGELCRQLARFNPESIILVENNEFALYMIDSWFKEHQQAQTVVPLTGDVKDSSRMEQIFAQYQPDIVFHAAAYKHVPLMEVGNAWQALCNNVLGTYTVAQQAIRYQAERFVLISTDKAVNPTNVMGSTKRMAEMVCQALHTENKNTQFQMVRFGNVLGSTGSVIPKFRKQIESGGPLTVTHPDVTRYFMSIPEAAQLVLQAAAMGNGGEIFVLDMGSPIKIVDLAKNMIRLAGYSEEEIKIVYTGLRPGEKMYEELLTDAEKTIATPHPKLRIAKARPAPKELLAHIKAWKNKKDPLADHAVRNLLQRWVPEYHPSCNKHIKEHDIKQKQEQEPEQQRTEKLALTE